MVLLNIGGLYSALAFFYFHSPSFLIFYALLSSDLPFYVKYKRGALDWGMDRMGDEKLYVETEIFM